MTNKLTDHQQETVEATLLSRDGFETWTEHHLTQDDARRFSSLSAQAAWCDAYYSARAISGASRETAIKEADKVMRRVRKALGYTYP